MNMFNNVIQKFIAATLGLSIVFAGISLTPALAQAQKNNGLHLGLQVNAKNDADNDDQNQNENAEVKFHNDTNFGLGNLNLDMKGTTSASDNHSPEDIVKPAQTAFKQTLKDANIAYKSAKKNAQVQLKASLNAATTQADHIIALKVYFSNVLAAFKVEASAIEAAFQAFINTNFGLNHPPVANAQSVTLGENSSVHITLTGSDPEGSLLTYIIVSTTTHGTLSGTAPHLTYTPNTGFTGTDSFTFKVNDGSLDSTLTTVSISVNQ